MLFAITAGATASYSFFYFSLCYAYNTQASLMDILGKRISAV